MIVTTLLPALSLLATLQTQPASPDAEPWPVIELVSVERILATGDIRTAPAWSPSEKYIVIGCRGVEEPDLVRRIRLSSGKADTVCTLRAGKVAGQVVWEERLGILVLESDGPIEPRGDIRRTDPTLAPIAVNARFANLNSPLPVYRDSSGDAWAIRGGSPAMLQGVKEMGETVCATDRYALCVDRRASPPSVTLCSVQRGTTTPLWKGALPAVDELTQFHIIDGETVMATVAGSDPRPVLDGRDHAALMNTRILKVTAGGTEPMTEMPAAWPALSRDGKAIAYLTVTPMAGEGEAEHLGYFALWVEDLRTNMRTLVSKNVDAVPAAWNRSRTKLAFVSGGDLYLATLRESRMPESEARRRLITAREQAEIAADMNLFKQLGMAIQMYRNDWDDEYPDAGSAEDLFAILQPYVRDISAFESLTGRGTFRFDFPSAGEEYDPAQREIAVLERYCPAAGLTAVVTVYVDGHVGVEY